MLTKVLSVAALAFVALAQDENSPPELRGLWEGSLQSGFAQANPSIPNRYVANSPSQALSRGTHGLDSTCRACSSEHYPPVACLSPFEHQCSHASGLVHPLRCATRALVDEHTTRLSHASSAQRQGLTFSSLQL